MLMNRTLYTLAIATLLLFVLSVSPSCNKVDKTNERIVKVSEVPTSGKPSLVPVIDETQLQALNEFNPSSGSSEKKYKSTDEVYGSLSERSYAFNECSNTKITYFMYGGISEDKTSGRWFCRKILKWDASSHAWKTFFDDGIQYYSSISDDITLQKGSWYYTLQWVWDPAAKSWIKFNADLLVQV
jgi:hypothetical protein